jgi:pimeloyl-ACP methyl ester carboxylesterase
MPTASRSLSVLSPLIAAPRLRGRHSRWSWAVCLSCLVLFACSSGPEPTYVPHDPALRELPLYFYPAPNGTRSARGLVFFFGNDIGFRSPQRDLASMMAGQGVDVVGYDMRPLLASLPDDPSARSEIFDARIAALIGAVRKELGADTLPIIIAGHSLGAEVALWTVGHASIPRLAGVLALSPGSRGHLQVSASDIVNSKEPSGPGSFGVAEIVARLPEGLRVALIRGEHDRFIFADSAIVAAGGARIQRYLVRFAGHSLKRIIVAQWVVRRALDWLLEPQPRPVFAS